MNEEYKIKSAWEQFLLDGDERTLKSVVDQHHKLPPDDAEYPTLHRIKDIILLGEGYRVIRFADPRTGQEHLYIIPERRPRIGADGVPYRLSGKKLIRWITEGTQNLLKGPGDWETL